MLRTDRPLAFSRMLLAASALVLAAFGPGTHARQSAAPTIDHALEAITPAVVKGHVQFLSHDLLEGRDTGHVGYEIAREYVASQYQRMGLEAPYGFSYVQPFDLLVATADTGSRLQVGEAVVTASEAAFAPDWLGEQPLLEGQGVYAGYGLVAGDHDDYRAVTIADRVVFLLSGLPADWLADPERSLLARTKAALAFSRGAKAVVILQLDGTVRPVTRTMALADGSAPAVRPTATIGPAASRRLLAAWGVDPAQALDVAASGKPREVGSVSLRRAHAIEKGMSWNVVGVVPGTDPALRDQTVVFTAHLDHVGVGEPDETGDRIYNGTHDNALGTGKMLAAAEAMIRLKPRRTVVFVAVGAEERGLLGSWYYVHHPVGSTRDIVANINHDGGLEGPPPDDVFAFGAEYSDLGPVLGEVAEAAGMRLRTDFQSPFTAAQALLFRSDQYSFLARGIPGIYLMDGFTIAGDPERGRAQWDHYLTHVNHQQRDNFDPSWTFEAPVRMAALSVRLAWRLANADSRPKMRGGPFPQSPDAPLVVRP
ncbi:M20/M25/M40 family metallo-hydrolase [soil metagenome]|nr:M28 family peptidase [Acidobacteriota bacterium]